MVSRILAAFPDARVHANYVRIRCPYHKDGKEKNPSMSILLAPKGTLPAGFCHCFACGKHIMLNEMLEDIGLEHIKLPDNSRQSSVRQVHLKTDTSIYKPQLPFRKSAYLELRGISEEVQERFKCYEKGDKVYLPVFSRDGVFLYTSARSVVGKRFYVAENAEKTLWGIEEVDFTQPIAICESQIDALSLWEIGIQAVATLGADNLLCVPVLQKSTSVFILAFDPDDAGRRAIKNTAKMLGEWRCYVLDLPQGVDVNQALQDIKDKNKFKSFIENRTVKYVQYST